MNRDDNSLAWHESPGLCFCGQSCNLRRLHSLFENLNCPFFENFLRQLSGRTNRSLKESRAIANSGDTEILQLPHAGRLRPGEDANRRFNLLGKTADDIGRMDEQIKDTVTAGFRVGVAALNCLIQGLLGIGDDVECIYSGIEKKLAAERTLGFHDGLDLSKLL